MLIEQVISGGQTGADQAGLAAARELGFKTGGYAPKGWLTDEGPRPELLKGYGLEETTGYSGYRTRTMRNVRISSCTLVFGNETSPGAKLTITHCKERNKPYLVVPFPTALSVSRSAQAVRSWLGAQKGTVLNIAGNRERTNPGIFAFTHAVLIEALGLEPHCSNPNCEQEFPF